VALVSIEISEKISAEISEFLQNWHWWHHQGPKAN
jgi:hypothetical protein